MSYLKQTEHNARRLAAVSRRIARDTDERNMLLRWLHEQGVSVRDLAAVSGLSKSNVHRIVRQDS